jgi:protocatechuate 3,4-dioxygenase beta subunit
MNCTVASIDPVMPTADCIDSLVPGLRPISRRAGFQGYGRTRADAQGDYAFRTIRPGEYPGRTPHIHLRAHPPAGGPPLTTQVYFPDEPLNARDGLLRRVAEARRAPAAGAAFGDR